MHLVSQRELAGAATKDPRQLVETGVTTIAGGFVAVRRRRLSVGRGPNPLRRRLATRGGSGGESISSGEGGCRSASRSLR